jgi:hypothetical protein
VVVVALIIKWRNRDPVFFTLLLTLVAVGPIGC